MATNHFTKIVEEVEASPQQNRADTLINGICKELQQSQNQGLSPQQMGQELQQVRAQLTQALQQGG